MKSFVVLASLALGLTCHAAVVGTVAELKTERSELVARQRGGGGGGGGGGQRGGGQGGGSNRGGGNQGGGQGGAQRGGGQGGGSQRGGSGGNQGGGGQVGGNRGGVGGGQGSGAQRPGGSQGGGSQWGGDDDEEEWEEEEEEGGAVEVDGGCTWTGHCLGDVCKADEDCDADWGCSSGVCSISGDTIAGEDDYDEEESGPKPETPFTQWSPTEPVVANPPKYTTVYVTLYPRATGAA